MPNAVAEPARRPRVVLVGLGHAHLFVLEAVRSGRLGKVELVVCTARDRHVYSGMLPGWLGGRFTLEELSFTVPALVASAGGQWIAHDVSGVDVVAKRVRLVNGEQVSFDVCSIAVGSAVAGAATPGVGTVAWPVKPLEQVLALAARVDALAHGGGRVVVVGGGIAGVELALNLRARTATCPRVSVALVTRGELVAEERGERASGLCERALADAGVQLLRGVTVRAVEAGALQAHQRGAPVTIPADVVVWATGAAAPAWLAQSGLPVARDGYLPVDATLRVVGAEQIFAAGDVATLVHAPDTPKAGVYAVRMGPHLVENLRHELGLRREPEPYRPQQRWLSLINVGDGTAIASWGPFAVRARWALRLKDFIDRRFVARFHRMP
jgi:pyridine nucleotide-disulfide oxidoreductase family protein